ncbi:MAG TPA: hypothetical protein VEH81_11680 [Ktedonobacteraceae bacterium]|nr:hypothetical protein [Ktedonobacteraceae bacterium]HYA98923.1 hypothetical protein [Ktedonobacteraceae bacterium]
MDPTQSTQMNQYLPWLIIAGVVGLFLLLRITRKGLRRRVDEIGYRLRGERGLMFWFWLNAPGVMLHELSHAIAVLLFYPFGFRITSITLFRVQPRVQSRNSGRGMKTSGKQSLQLGEVQYTRPQGRLLTYIGDGLSGIAPLFGGIAMFILLYWLATGYNLWDYVNNQHAILRPYWPWWTLIFVPYLILTVTSELWPSSADWHGARWFVGGLALFIIVIIALLWLTGRIVFNHALLLSTSSIAKYIDFALLVLVGLYLVFLAIAELLVQLLRR